MFNLTISITTLNIIYINISRNIIFIPALILNHYSESKDTTIIENGVKNIQNIVKFNKN